MANITSSSTDRLHDSTNFRTSNQSTRFSRPKHDRNQTGTDARTEMGLQFPMISGDLDFYLKIENCVLLLEMYISPIILVVVVINSRICFLLTGPQS